jgi:hypothetical protein
VLPRELWERAKMLTSTFVSGKCYAGKKGEHDDAVNVASNGQLQLLTAATLFKPNPPNFYSVDGLYAPAGTAG